MDNKGISIAALLQLRNQVNPEPARRCLFGPLNKQYNNQFVQEQLKAHHDEMKNKWNFDFKSESPLKGKYNWEQVSNRENIPHPYRLPHLMFTDRISGEYQSCKDLALLDINKCKENVPKDNQNCREGESIQQSSPAPSTESRQLKRKQTTITDYFSIKKKKMQDGK